MYRQTVRRDISTPEEIREQLSHASSRRNSILGGQPSSDDDSVQLAAQRMRQSVQRMHRPPEPQEEQIKDAYSEPKRTMSEEDRQAVFRPTKRISLDEVNKERSAENDWEAEEAAVNQKRSRRKKHSLLDEDMEIMDLNDL